MTTEKELEKQYKHLSPKQQYDKLCEMGSRVHILEAKLKRMRLLLERFRGLESDISYHAKELQILRKLKKIANNEVSVVFGL